MEPKLWAGTADRFWLALDEGNVERALGCCIPTFTTWHNFDRKELDLKQSSLSFRFFVDAFVERSTTRIRRDFFAEGIFQQHVLVVRAKEASPRMAWAVCVVMRFSGEKIASLAEYIDRSSAFNPDREASWS